MAIGKKPTKSSPRNSEKGAGKKSAPWKRANPKPKGARTKLSAADKEKARARAAKAGRRYPNLVDNMWAAKAAKS